MGRKKKFSGLEISLMAMFSMVVIVAVVLIVFLAMGEPATKSEDVKYTPECSPIPDSERIDCYPDGGASKDKCAERGCCWYPLSTTTIPWCFFSKNRGYEVLQQDKTSKGYEAKLKRLPAPTLFGNETENAQLIIEIQSQNRLHFKIIDSEKNRFEVPHEHIQQFNGPAASRPNFEVELTNKPFALTVRRTTTKKVLFDTSIGPLQFADQYLQLTAKLPSLNVYGLGEHVHQHFLHDMNWKTWPIFTRDGFPNGGTHNLYGHQTFFLCLEDGSGTAFGVFLMNSNAMDVILQPAPAVTYRTIGGILDFYIFLGNSPEEVVQEYLELIGRPVMPAYWSLGFQLSRWNYGTLDEVKATVQRNREIPLPYDIQYTDIDYMEDKKDFTYDLKRFGELPQFAEDLHSHGQKYIIILDPAIATSPRVSGPYKPYQSGTARGVWVNESDGRTPIVGEVWPGETVFPDYTNPECTNWWVEECESFYQDVKYDALWIDMNEVSSFQPGSIKGCERNSLNYPPYTPKILDNLMYSKTLCMDAKQKWGSHYDVHSLYGYSMILSTDKAIRRVFPGKRSLILSRSSFAGSGKYSGHWLGDNAANWNDIKWAIPGMLEFNLFGMPYIGADICGFFDDTTEELCRRWMQVGAFYPYARNHNAEGYKPQDPAYFGADSLLVKTSINYLNIRYTLLPYLYTLFYQAHVKGTTVVRPMMHEFPKDNKTWNVDRQFMWGSGLLITPVLDPGTDTVTAYIPDAVWYEYETDIRITERKQETKMFLPADKIGLHLRGGVIFPTQKPAVTTVYSRRNPLGLIIALDDNDAASGEFFWDDGESRDTIENGVYIHYHFLYDSGILKIKPLTNGYKDPNNIKFEEIKILGMSVQPLTVIIRSDLGNISVPSTNISYNNNTKTVIVTGLQLELGQNYVIDWNVNPNELERFDCHPEENANEAACLARNCIWKPAVTPKVPWCFYPEDYGYIVSEVVHIPQGIRATITRNTAYVSPYGSSSPPIDVLQVDIKYLSNYMLQFKISDPKSKRYEVPIPLNVPSIEVNPVDQLYDVSISNQPFGIKVKRKSTGTVIWDSVLPGFIFTDMFIQISTRFPSKYVYGFGETEHTSFRHDLNWLTWGMFAKDQPPGYQLNCYGSHPFYMALEEDANAHGVLLLNSNAMDVTLQPTPALTYRTIGGILDFYMVLGPTPEMVVQEYTALVGRPVLPAYWSLGFQLCRYGYQNDSEISQLYEDMKKADIPYDVQYADIDYMERQLDFTLSEDFKGFPDLINKMRGEGMRIIIILDPAISGNETKPYLPFSRGIQDDVFIKFPDTNYIVWGKVWPDIPGVVVNESLDWEMQVELYRAYAAFPDFFRNITAQWWQREIEDYYNKTLKFDGLWIDMNEPASFVHGSTSGCSNKLLNNPPYMPPLESKHLGLFHKTLCMESEQTLQDGTPVRHYDVHNLYGWSHAKPTYDAVHMVTGQRGIVVTRSTFPSSGKWVGHWLGDNTAAWDQIYKSVIGMMEFSLFGISYTGADICGFFKDATYEMCTRWMQVGAFYPYSRNHNGKGSKRQDPVAWNETFANNSRKVLRIRYTLLPYLYTLLFQAHSQGSTVIRPVLHEFFKDKTTWDIYKQFMWGPALLISPAMDEGLRDVHGYMPDARWYDYYTGRSTGIRGQWVDMPTPLDHINLHIRGGYVIPWQEPSRTTVESRKNLMGLTVALDDNGFAQGSLYWDDGNSIDTYEKGDYFLANFAVNKNVLFNNIQHDSINNTAGQLQLGHLKVWGSGNLLIQEVNAVYDGREIRSLNFTHNLDTEVLAVNLQEHNIYMNKPIQISWNIYT
ncbi:sucrase-isomaltase, intestinal [Erpetoichthys calabaricus]|uniref:sucrase-isomaltase, intestinal n=1 Tax=Erpetoichthys calabaricus TaxID=27687 RepID=UPI002234CEB9|nr:sucrase-isomaltase, intestinal [Erpetoichthys calabaricus]XP_051779279.1 sucrase-isomaltase, intestinal [Erpetoichthys calabaricus]